MNPLSHPEFWLSLSFLIVLGLILFSPIQKCIKSFFSNYHDKIIAQIQEAKNIYKEAENTYKATLKESKKPYQVSFSKEVQKIKRDFLEKEKVQIESQKQDFQTRKNIHLMQTKNRIRTYLLNETEKKLFEIKVSPKQNSQDIQHFIKKLHEEQNALKELL